MSSVVTEIYAKSYISTEWFDHNDFLKDTRLKGEEVSHDYLLQ